MAEEVKLKSEVTPIDVVAYMRSKGDDSKKVLKVSELKQIISDEFGWDSKKFNEESHKVAELKGIFRDSDYIVTDDYSTALLSLLDPVAEKFTSCARTSYLYNLGILDKYTSWYNSKEYPKKKKPTASGVKNGEILLMAVDTKNDKLVELCQKWEINKETGKIMSLNNALDLDFAKKLYSSL